MKDQIKSYLQRLNNGETLESVQADFVRECKDVDPSAIMQAEQELLREGTSIEELQRLCDVHPPCSMVPRQKRKLPMPKKQQPIFQMPRNCTLRTYKTNGSPLLPP